MNNTIIEALNWRYAVKKFDPIKKVSPEDFATILEAGHLAPSSMGLQPWTFISIENPEIRKALAEIAYNKSQILDSTYYLLITIPKVIDAAYIDRFVKQTAQVQQRTVESLDKLRESLTNIVASKKTEAELQAWFAKQAYIAFGMMIETAALLHVDACPMEGFDKEKFAAIVGTEALGLNIHAALALGYRAADDPASTRAKVRFPQEEIVIKK